MTGDSPISEIRSLKIKITQLENENSELLSSKVNNRKNDDLEEKEKEKNELNLEKIAKLENDNSALTFELRNAKNEITEIKRELKTLKNINENLKSAKNEKISPKKDLKRMKQENLDNELQLQQQRQVQLQVEQKERIRFLSKQLDNTQHSLKKSLVGNTELKSEKEALTEEIKKLKSCEIVFNDDRKKTNLKYSAQEKELKDKLTLLKETENNYQSCLTENAELKNQISVLSKDTSELETFTVRNEEEKKEMRNFLLLMEEDKKADSEKIIKLSEYVFILQTQLNLMNSFVNNIETITDGQKYGYTARSVFENMRLCDNTTVDNTEKILNDYYEDKKIFNSHSESSQNREIKNSRKKKNTELHHEKCDVADKNENKNNLSEKSRDFSEIDDAENFEIDVEVEVKNCNKMSYDDSDNFDLYDVYCTDKQSVRSMGVFDDNYVTVENYENYEMKNTFQQTNSHHKAAVLITDKLKNTPLKRIEECNPMKNAKRKKNENKLIIMDKNNAQISTQLISKNESHEKEIASNHIRSASEIPPVLSANIKIPSNSFESPSKSIVAAPHSFILTPRRKNPLTRKRNDRSNAENKEVTEDENHNKDNDVGNAKHNLNDETEKEKNNDIHVTKKVVDDDVIICGSEIDSNNGFAPGLKGLLDLKFELDKQLESLNSQKLEYEKMDRSEKKIIQVQNQNEIPTNEKIELNISEKNKNRQCGVSGNIILDNVNNKINNSPVIPILENVLSKSPISSLSRIKELSYDEINEIYQQQMLHQMQLQLQQQNDYELNFQHKLLNDRKILENEKTKLQNQIEQQEQEYYLQEMKNLKQKEEIFYQTEKLIEIQKERKLIYEDLQQLNKLKLIMQEDLKSLKSNVNLVNENGGNEDYRNGVKSKSPSSPDSHHGFQYGNSSFSNGASSASKDKQHIHQLVEALKIAKTAVEISHLDLNKTQEKMTECIKEVDHLQNENRLLRLHGNVKTSSHLKNGSVNIIERNINSLSQSSRSNLVSQKNNNSISSNSTRHKYH